MKELLPRWPAAYRGGGHWVAARDWSKWKNFVTAPYIAETHAGRYVVNFANDVAARVYGRFEKLKAMPPGGVIAKPSFTIGTDGRAEPGPLFIMEKMKKGWNPQTGDWRYAMIMPGGRTFGITGGTNGKGMAFCHECHAGAKENDYLFFADEDVRRK